MIDKVYADALVRNIDSILGEDGPYDIIDPAAVASLKQQRDAIIGGYHLIKSVLTLKDFIDSSRGLAEELGYDSENILLIPNTVEVSLADNGYCLGIDSNHSLLYVLSKESEVAGTEDTESVVTKGMEENYRNRIMEAFCSNVETLLAGNLFVTPGAVSSLEQQMDAIFKGYILVGEVGYAENVENHDEQMKTAENLVKSRDYDVENILLIPMIDQKINKDTIDAYTTSFNVYAKPLDGEEQNQSDIGSQVEQVMEQIE